MAIHVIQSQRIEVLLQGVTRVTQQIQSQPLQVLAIQHFIVPNQAVERWLNEKMAELQGIQANYLYHQGIRGFQWYTYQQVLAEHKDQVRKANIPRLILKWRIYQALHPYIQTEQMDIAQDHPLYSIVHRIYDQAERQTTQLERQLKKQHMLYWVAEQVSKLFSHYMVYRGSCQKNCSGPCSCQNNWLASWGRDQALDVETLLTQRNQETSAFKLQQAEELELWQRWLWHTHFHQDFLEIEKIDDLFWSYLDSAPQQKNALKYLPKQVVLFTLLDLPPSQLQFLRRLGQYIDIYIFHYNPSQEYWADSVDPLWKQRYDVGVKERFIQKYPKASDADIAEFFTQFTLHFNAESRESRHPLLTRLGKQARDHFSLLSNLATGEEGHWVDAFVDEFPNHLLGHIQSDILHLAEPQAEQYTLAKHDDSIQIHVCHSSLRQLEVLKDQLIYWLAQGTSEQPRKPNDILVLTPQLKQIEPLIRSVFPATASSESVFLPVKIAGVAQLDVLNAWRAVVGRIQLLQGRFNDEEFADWLTLEASQQCYGLDDYQVSRILTLLGAAGFKRGFDAEHLQQSLAAEDNDYRYSFKFALDRLALGIAVAEHAVFESTLSYAEVQPDDFELVGKLIQIYQDFSKRRHWLVAHEQLEQPIKVEIWLKHLLQDVKAFEQAGVVALQAAREALEKQETMITLASFYGADQQAKHLRQTSLPLAYILAEVQQTLENQSAQAEPTGQITFSQIGQIRPLPYRLVVLLNLDQGQFPNRETHIPFDLMDLLRPQLGDRSRLDDDQGAFLDALLLARDNFWLFYNGYDVNDGEAREPSSIVQEFRAHLALIVKADSETEQNPPNANDVVQTSRMTQLKALAIPTQLESIHRIHPLQPFDVSGFQPQAALYRYQDHWYQVATHIQQPKGQRKPWVDTATALVQETALLNSQQWIADVTFPARLYLKNLGVENHIHEMQFEQDEPLFLNGLGKYAIRHFLHQHQHQSSMHLLLDQLPVGKIKQSAWQQSVFEQERLQERLGQYASQETATTYRIWRLQSHLSMNIRQPIYDVTDWVSMEASSARAKRIAGVWLEYLIWLASARATSTASDKRRIVVFSDQTIICTGVSTEQAQHYIQAWLEAWQYGLQQPLVLPAALILKPLEKDRQYQWQESPDMSMQLLDKDRDSILKEWSDPKSFSSIDVTQDESSQFHRDWAFILQEQDAKALLQVALTQFSYALYAPIFQHVQVV